MMQHPFDNLPPPMLVAVIGTVSWAIVAIVLGIAFFRYRARRFEQSSAPQLPPELSARLSRIENAVDSIALEVERISESQRFLTKLQAERVALPSPAGGSGAPERR